MMMFSVQLDTSLCDTQCYFCGDEFSDKVEFANASDCVTTTVCEHDEVHL